VNALGPTTVAALCAPFGLLIGSFLNVVIWRIPRGESVVRPPSHCPGCDTPLRPLDNIPVVSWIALRGRCRTCSTSISIRYPLVELACGLLFAAVGARLHDSWALFAYLVLVAALLALSMIDLDHLLLPNKVIYPTAAIFSVLLVVASAANNDWDSLLRAAIGAAIDFGIFFAIWFIAPSAMGFGDVRLSALLGAALGWISFPALWLGIFLPFMLGTVGGIALAAPIVLVPMGAGAVAGWFGGTPMIESITGAEPIDPTQTRALFAVAGAIFLGAAVFLVLSAKGKVERGRHIPFGPYLALGALIAVFAFA
jgi:leader peptidase (prepilin peptidase) / N-methyltransferase